MVNSWVKTYSAINPKNFEKVKNRNDVIIRGKKNIMNYLILNVQYILYHNKVLAYKLKFFTKELCKN